MPAIPIAQLVPGTRYVIYRPDIPDDVPHPAGQLFILNRRSMYGLIPKFAGIPPDYITEYHYPGTRREYYAVGDPDIPVAPAAPAAPAPAAPAVPAAANYAIPESAGERAAIAARSDALLAEATAEANAAGRAAKKAQTIAAAGGAGGGGPRKNRRRTRRATRNRRLSRRNNRRNDRRN